MFSVVGDGDLDTIDGGLGTDTLQGSVYNDVFRVNATGTNWTSVEVLDGAGTDSIRGTTGNDVINLTGLTVLSIENIDGAAGDDTITGTAGADRFTGGSGNDTFVFQGSFGNDVVGDFAAGAAAGDVLRISLGASFDTYDEVMAAAVQVGTSTIITIDAASSIELLNVQKVSLVANDFTFF